MTVPYMYYYWAAALTLEAYRPQARNGALRDTLLAYLQARQTWIPTYRQRRNAHEENGSGHAEKANDLIVARWPTGCGMQWSFETSDALAALRALLLNRGRDCYWQRREVLPLVAS